MTVSIDYPMLYESIVLRAWGKRSRADDPLGFGDANVLGGASQNLDSWEGHRAKFGLSMALKKLARDNEGNDEYTSLTNLDKQLWSAKTYTDLCSTLKEMERLFDQLEVPY